MVRVSVILALCVATAAQQQKLILLPAASGAVCLDGTPGGFYLRPATTEVDKNKWVIFFQGGGWCYNLEDCLGRSNTDIGSSKNWGPTLTMDGIFSADCSQNPVLCNYNLVHMNYCDGNSFSGDLGGSVVHNGVPLYFRGHTILREALDLLAREYNLTRATDVLLTGCSAGGLATYIHTNYVGDFLAARAPDLVRYKSAPVSGFFLDTSNAAGEPVYGTQMRYVFDMQHALGGVDPSCVQGVLAAGGEVATCNFAATSYAYVRYPIFVLNSMHDSWQFGCILTAELTAGFPDQTGFSNGNCTALSGWEACVDHNRCTAEQQAAVARWQRVFLATFSSVTALPGNGAFITNSDTHCAPSSRAWASQTIGGVVMNEAFAQWWDGPSSTPASKNTRICPLSPAAC